MDDLVNKALENPIFCLCMSVLGGKRVQGVKTVLTLFSRRAPFEFKKVANMKVQASSEA